ncbi:MAG: hydrogen peroxide-dependent heme synthase [Gaiellales bacterium]|nr:hydrogen peroxide-dependent heme synthase [Gaiellales bacterium]
MTDPLLASEGWGVIHLYFRLLGDRREAIALAEADALVAEFTAEAPYQAIWTAPLGDRADLGLMLIGPDMVRLERLRGALMRSELGRRLEPVPELGLVSLTELSEYTSREGSEEHMAMLERRVHPRLPRRRLLCFYPMAKRREGADNWYSLPYDERRSLMGGHGKLGAKFSGRVIQLITGATGLSDWEWGVTLIADDPKDIKDIVYEMRFDAVSARYGLFGPFTLGLVAPLREALEIAGATAA